MKKLKRKTKIIIRKESFLTCGYCQIFSDSNSKRTENGIERFCKVANERVSLQTSACNDFMVSKYFYCLGYNCWLHPFLCIKRKERNMEHCQKCRQFDKEIFFVLQEWQKERELKRKLRKKIREQILYLPKKKLKRR